MPRKGQGVPDYTSASATAGSMEFHGEPVKVVDLQTLILAKQAAGDPKARKQSALAYLWSLKKKG